jgi:hypothetical protein
MKARELSTAAATVGSSIAAMCADGSIKVSDRIRRREHRHDAS